jgi:cyclopropane fatty-acyl-phospholipid synthase-like methyltransferase
MASDHENNVEQYYDNNTRIFLKRGAHAQTFNIHQALWAPGVQTTAEAVNYSNRLLLERAQALQAKQIVDLGCGVGSSVLYLADALPQASLQGITISQAQTRLANQAIAHADLADRCTVLQGSFQALPPNISTIDMAYAIEAFVHGPDARIFFQQISDRLSPNGQVILIDDFLSSQAPRHNKHQRLIERFKAGWLLGSLLSVQEVEQAAQAAGLRLIDNVHLTHWLPLQRPRDFLVHAYVWLLDLIGSQQLYHRSLRGGDARWQGLRKGVFEYRMLVFGEE